MQIPGSGRPRPSPSPAPAQRATLQPRMRKTRQSWLAHHPCKFMAAAHLDPSPAQPQPSARHCSHECARRARLGWRTDVARSGPWPPYLAKNTPKPSARPYSRECARRARLGWHAIFAHSRLLPTPTLSQPSRDHAAANAQDGPVLVGTWRLQIHGCAHFHGFPSLPRGSFADNLWRFFEGPVPKINHLSLPRGSFADNLWRFFEGPVPKINQLAFDVF